MSTVTDTQAETLSLKHVMQDYWARVKAGDIGSLPAVLGLVALCLSLIHI